MKHICIILYLKKFSNPAKRANYINSQIIDSITELAFELQFSVIYQCQKEERRRNEKEKKKEIKAS